MRHYTKILVWENNRRLNKLAEFRTLVIEYFNNADADWLSDRRIENQAAQVARSKINRVMEDAHSMILNSGIIPIFRYIPPPIVGGVVTKVNPIRDIFNLDGFRMDPNHVLDFIDQAIGIYESNHKSAFFRMFNPFFYLGWFLDVVSDLPFIAFGKLGFNRQKAEASAIGKLVKGVFYLSTRLAAFLTILYLLDFLEPVKQFVHKLLGSSKAN